MQIQEHSKIENLLLEIKPAQLRWYADKDYPGLIYKDSEGKLWSQAFVEFEERNLDHITLKEIVQDKG